MVHDRTLSPLCPAFDGTTKAPAEQVHHTTVGQTGFEARLADVGGESVLEENPQTYLENASPTGVQTHFNDLPGRR